MPLQKGSLISSMVGVEANTILPRDGDVNLTFESGHLLGITRFGGNVYCSPTQLNALSNCRRSCWSSFIYYSELPDSAINPSH